MEPIKRDVLLKHQNEDGQTEIHYPITQTDNVEGLEAELARRATNATVNAHVNNTDVHVNPTTMGNYDTAIAGLIEHTEDKDIHISAAERAAWTEGAATAAAALEAANEAKQAASDFESRLTRLEDGVFNNITGNPYLVSFDSLDGVSLVMGIWNRERQRIEC